MIDIIQWVVILLLIGIVLMQNRMIRVINSTVRTINDTQRLQARTQALREGLPDPFPEDGPAPVPRKRSGARR